MQELQMEELDQVNGGFGMIIVAAGIAVVVAAGVGFFIGYREAGAGAKK
ncbi:class IIb bacteriocin, lactobin A/cerein 7B family [Massilia putida]|nr:class IIb bacteriocin, lactobin A/cerein 7B family [Massilia putida]